MKFKPIKVETKTDIFLTDIEVKCRQGKSKKALTPQYNYKPQNPKKPGFASEYSRNAGAKNCFSASAFQSFGRKLDVIITQKEPFSIGNAVKEHN